MSQLTLLRKGDPLSDVSRQREVLECAAVPDFADVLSGCGQGPLRTEAIKVLQVNVGKLCNQTCRHCHVDAGPDRREVMSRETVDACLSVLERTGIETLDITGGAPEMNPHFRDLVSAARRLRVHVIDRCNLTILLAPGFTDLPQFLAEQRVEIIASLPCYLEENCDRQRGDGVFNKSIEAIRRLNAVGYGLPGSELPLNLVYNPVGPSLPPPQEALEQAYREQLRSRFGVEFSGLYTITNMPISRFLDDLLHSGEYNAYMQKLLDAFNPAAVAGVMCRTMISVDWQGLLYDCDFNQMLGLPVAQGVARTIFEFDRSLLEGRPVVTSRHCFGCTAGAGSSCQGALLDARGS